MPYVDTGTDLPVETEDQEEDGEQAGMTEAEVESAVRLLAQDAVKYNDELAGDREDAMKLYLGGALGNEETGRSTFVYTVVRNVINMIMPSLMRIFFGGERYVEFAPRSTKAIESAEQVNEFIGDVVINTDNNGVMIYHAAFLDALIKNVGVFKWWRDEDYQSQDYTATVVMEQLFDMQQDPEITLTSVEQSGIYGNFEVEYTQNRDESLLRFGAVPPWEFLSTRDGTTVKDATFIGHRCEKTVSELRKMGIPEEILEAHGHGTEMLSDLSEKVVQTPTNAATTPAAAVGPRETQKVLYVEGYPYMDIDGDGYAELVRVPMIGSGLHVVHDLIETVPRRPFAVLTPHPLPHELIGLSETDFTKPLQRIMSMISRSMLDSLALSLHPRVAYVEGEVSLEDLMNTEIGAPIRMERPEAITEFKHSFVGGDALPVLQFFESLVETTTGVTKAAEGLNAGDLQSATKMAVANTITAAQQQVELIARIFAETGIKELMQGLLEETIAHPPRKRIARVRGQYVEVDPRAWEAKYDIKTTVAIGAGLVDDQINTLAMLAQKMEASFQLMGPSNALTNLGRYRALLVKMAKLKGRKDGDIYFNPLPLDWTPPPEPPKESPEDQIAKAEIMKAQASVAKAQADVQFEAQKQKLEEMRNAADLQLKREEMMLKAKLETAKIEAELLVKQTEITLQYQGQQQAAAAKQQTDLAIANLREETKLAIEQAKQGSGERIIRIQKYDVETGKPSEVSVETESKTTGSR